MSVKIGKKIVFNQPKFGDKSVYNYEVDTEQMVYQTTGSLPDTYQKPIGWPNPDFSQPEENWLIPMATNDFKYEESIGLPKSHDKFSEKDLYTISIGDPMNEKIIQKNLKYEAENSITINNLYVANAGVDGTVKNVAVAVWIFSKEAYDGDPTRDGYGTLKAKLAAHPNWRIYLAGFGNKSQGSDIGSIESVEGIPIIQNFAGTVENVITQGQEFPGGGEFNPLGDTTNFNQGGAFELNNVQQQTETNLIINESVDNPLYVVIFTQGDKKVAWPIKTDSRKKKYSVYKISNTELFTKAGDSYTGKVQVFNFSSPDSVRTGEGGGGAQASAWTISQFQMTINTSVGIKNDFVGVEEFGNDIPEVLPPIPLVESSIFDFEALALLNPKNQLINNELSGLDMGTEGFLVQPTPGEDEKVIYPDYDVIAKISPVDIDNQLTDIDLQSYYENDLIKSFKASAPSTVSFRLAFAMSNDFESNTEDTTTTTGTWNPNNILFMEKSTEPQSDGSITDLYHEELSTNPSDAQDDGSYAPNYYYYFVVDWNDIENKIKTVDDYIQSKPENRKDYLEKTQDDLYVVKKVTQGQYSSIPIQEDDTVLKHTYTTPGIKTIKIITISGTNTNRNPEEYISNNIQEFGRWKLVTCRFYLDIPTNEYPDFGELGGSDYTTIPWPNTSPVIGGVSENSKYKISVQDTLSGGKIGNTDIIDEKFFVTDLENDELGKNVNMLDLEQFRYFNKPYDINELLMIPILPGNKYSAPYSDISGSLTQTEGYWTGNTYNRTFSEESSVGQIFISDNQDIELKESCKIEINTGNLIDNSIYDSSGNSNKGLLIGDYKVKKVRKGEPMRRDSFIKVPKTINNKNGAL